MLSLLNVNFRCFFNCNASLVRSSHKKIQDVKGKGKTAHKSDYIIDLESVVYSFHMATRPNM